MLRSILAVSEGGPDNATPFRLAARVALQFQSAVDAIYFSWRKPGDVDIAAQAMPFLADQDKRRLAARAKGTEAAYSALIAGIPGATFTNCNELAKLVDMGRRSDLIVVGRPVSDPENGAPLNQSTMIHECARPVMVAPPNVTAGRFSSVLVAWNGSRQAARAAGYALPFLKQADDVTVVVVGGKPDDFGAAMLVGRLGRHGVTASLDVVDIAAASGRARGRALLGHAKDKKSDLLVMGAYGGGQLAGFLGLGGATGKVISSCPIPLVMAH
ncbi:MAG: universal stress protein [Reyranellales bacterium]